MPAYPPRNLPVRKQEILLKREVSLLHALRHDYSQEKIHKAATAVREAHINLSKAKLVIVRREDKDNHARVENVLEEESKWQAMSIEDIVHHYQNDT
jgi:hypothetical protein